MTKEDLQRIRNFYEQTILQQVIRPLEINKIYCLIHPEELNPMGMAYKFKQRAISVFMGTKYQEVLNELQDLFNMTIESPEVTKLEKVYDDLTKRDSIENFIDTVESALPKSSDTLSVSSEGQSHQEDLDVVEMTDAELQTKIYTSRIQELETEYQQTTDSGRRRSISMKISNMKKKLK